MSVAAVAPETVREFYDAHVADKIADFVDGNPRVAAAWETIRHWSPSPPRTALDIGCGFGQVSWWMARRWPQAEVRGLDLSPRAVELASRVFRRDNLSFATDDLSQLPDRRFDLVTLIDVYEHIAVHERPGFNHELSRILADGGTVILTFPTAAHQRVTRERHPAQLQPIDEDVDVDVMQALAAATRSRIVMYAECSIWTPSDYAHAVLTRRGAAQPVVRREAPAPTLVDRAVRKLRSRFHEDDDSREARLRLIEQTLGPGAYRPRS